MCDSLLNDPVFDRRNSKESYPTVWFRYFNPSYGLGLVFSLADLSGLFLHLFNAIYAPNSCTVMPFTPAAPLFLFTCLNAQLRLSVSNIWSSSFSSSILVISFLSREVGIHFHAVGQWTFPSFLASFAVSSSYVASY